MWRYGCPKSPQWISSCSTSDTSLVVECMSKNNECRAIEVIGQDWSSEVVALLIEDCELITTWTNLISRDRLVQFHWHTFSGHNELNQKRNPEFLGFLNGDFKSKKGKQTMHLMGTTENKTSTVRTVLAHNQRPRRSVCLGSAAPCFTTKFVNIKCQNFLNLTQTKPLYKCP